MRSPVALCTLIFAGLFIPCVTPRAKAQTVTVAAPVASLIREGDSYFANRNYAKALDSYQKAEKVSHHECAPCLLREISIYKMAGDFDTALDRAKKAEDEAGDNKAEKANALLAHASLLAALASKPKDKKLVQAVADTREALTLDPAASVAHFNLGVLLMRQEQDADGAAELKTYLASSNTDAATMKAAREDLADPRRAREPYAPEFSFTTAENEQVSLASLHGKVALLDFWGSWCPPCRASIPTIASLQKAFAKKGVEVVGISSDDDADAWKKFIAANRMVWPEYLDSDGQVQHAFQVDSFPTYIVLDPNGVIRFRQSGFAEGISGGEISEALDKALKVKLDTPAPPVASASAAATLPASPANGTASSANGPESGSNAPATSAYGYAEPTYVHVPAHEQPPASAANSAPDDSGGLPIALRLATPTNGANFTDFLTSLTSLLQKLRWARLSALPSQAEEGRQGSGAVKFSEVDFSVGRDGKLTVPPSLSRSCGDASFDRAVVAVISAAGPFPSFPTDFPGAAVEIQAYFLYSQPAPLTNK